MKATRVLETCLYVDDLCAAEDFYRRVLGLEFHSREERRHVFFRCGDAMFLLFVAARTEEKGTSDVPRHGAHGPGHAAFVMEDGEVDAWRDHLRREGVPIERDMAWPAGGRSLYFRDPAGNSLELATPSLWGQGQPNLDGTRRTGL